MKDVIEFRHLKILCLFNNCIINLTHSLSLSLIYFVFYFSNNIVHLIVSGAYEDPIEMSAFSQVIDDEHMLKIRSNFKRLGDRCYLENAGTTLYPQSLLVNVNEDLMSNVYMNPHSDKYTKDCIEQIRCMILRHFNTDPSNYTVIFTSGTTHSLKLILEAFRFSSISDPHNERNNGAFVYLRDNHTSVLGLRELASDKNADVIHIGHDEFLTAMNKYQNHKTSWKDKYKSNDGPNTLFVYPAQSNFNGYKYPIDAIDNIKDGGLISTLKKNLCQINNNWYVLLDAASFVSTSKLDLSKTQPDFVCLSFYKIFGYPTGLGALLVKNSSQDVLSQKKHFGGGTVDIVLSSEDYHMKKANLCERFEDGTVSFLSIIALKHCFDTMQKLIPRTRHANMMDTISYHTFSLAKDLFHQLQELRHSNGNNAAVLYMDSDFSDIKKQGGIVTFNILRDDKSYVGYAEFQHMADLFNISVRTGCFCNSGSCQRHLMSTNKEMKEMYKAGHVCGDEIDLINGRPTGAIRVSFGYFNSFHDVDKLITMICRCFVKGNYRKSKRVQNNKFTLLDSIKSSKLMNSLANLHKILSSEDELINNLNEEQEYAQLQSKIVVKEAAIFPIKSCGAFKIRFAWKIGPKGFEYDREWMIIKDTGVCLTQKHNSRMCMIRPKIDLKQRTMTLHFKEERELGNVFERGFQSPRPFERGFHSLTQALNRLAVKVAFVSTHRTCTGKTPITIPMDSAQNRLKESSLCNSKVCTDTVQGYDCGDDVANWISEALEVSYLRLIKQSSADHRIQKKTMSGEKTLLSLSNQAQFLLINKATVRWLHDKIRDPLFVDNLENLTDRFRGNIIIDMENELVERDWHKLIIGNLEFRVEGQCNRCQMVCIDQQTGEKTAEPLRTISEQFGGKMRFGIYLSYLGSLDGSDDHSLKIDTPVTPIINDDDISR